MTVASATSAVTYTGTGSTSVFPFTWQVNSAADLVVFTWVPATGVITQLALNTGYTLTGIGSTSGGTVTLVAGNLASGTNLFIASDPALVQSLTLNQAAAFNASDIMNQLDYLTREVQAARRIATNALQIPEVESLAGLITTFPCATQRAGKYVAFDASGNATTTTVAASGGLIPSNITQLVATIAALRTYAFTPASGYVVQTAGSAAAGDGGGMEYYWNPSDTRSDNGTTIIQITGTSTGRWNALQLGGIVTQVTNVAALRAYIATPFSGAAISTLGYYAAGDGGGGDYYWNASDTRTDNGGSVIQITGVSTGRWNLRIVKNVYNVRQFGAYGDYSHDDTSAIQATFAAMTLAATNNCTLYFPDGQYVFSSQLNLTNGPEYFSILGNGASSILRCTTMTTGHGILVGGGNTLWMSIRNLYLAGGEMGQGYFYFSITDSAGTRCQISGIQGEIDKCGGIQVNGVTFVAISDCSFDSGYGNYGQGCLQLNGCSFAINNCQLRTTNTVGSLRLSQPCVTLNGPFTSGRITNCDLQGGGPVHWSTISSIASNSSNFTVTTSAAHTFAADDVLVIRGASVAAYNSCWRIASVTSTTITVTYPGNPGASTGGTAESVSACLLFTSQGGYAHESTIANILCENDDGTYEYGTASILLDGRTNTSADVENIGISNCEVDFGAMGIMLSAYPESSTYAGVAFITITGCHGLASTRGIHIDGAKNVRITGCNICQAPPYEHLDYVAGYGSTATTAGLYIHGGSTAAYADAIFCVGNSFGPACAYQSGHSNNYSYAYGVIYDNTTNGALETHAMVGNHIFGYIAAFLLVGYQLPATRNLMVSGNLCSQGSTFPYGGAMPSIASASSITLYPAVPVQKITGTTSIATISEPILPASVGTTYQLVFASALSLVTGGNLAITATYSVLAGQMVTIVFDGTSWYVK